jgi:hypothetical protein
MATIFTNVEFYADPDPTSGAREPIALQFEDPLTPDPDPGGGGVVNPDPGGPGGGTGDGGDIGNIDGSGTSTLGNAPNLTRKTHSQDIFVASGGTMSITYVADGDCTILPKRPRADMTVSYTDDGREMTITWTVPPMAGDSTYVGAEAHVFGGDTEEAISSIWDRLHINKVASNIKTIGTTAYPRLQTGIQRPDVVAGDTIVINDGTYTDYYDRLNVGFWGGLDGNAANLTTPNGVASGVTTVNVIGSDGVTVTGTENIVNISKFTTIMAATPLGVILDRQNTGGAVRLYGRYRATGNNGGRDIHGIKIKGIALRNAVDFFSMQYVDECAFEFCSVVSGVNPEEFTAATGLPWGLNYIHGFNDGGSFGLSTCRNCVIDACQQVSNNRFGYVFGAGLPEGTPASKHNTISRSVHTTACVQGNLDTIVQGFIVYGGRSNDLVNCMSIDSAFFRDGYRNSYRVNEPVTDGEHYSFMSTRGDGDDIYAEGLISLNTTQGGFRISAEQGPSRPLIQSTIKNSVFWDRKSDVCTGPMLFVNRGDVTNVTIGKVETVASYAYSCISDKTANNISNTLMIHGGWNYSHAATDLSISYEYDASGVTVNSSDTNFGVIPPSAANPDYFSRSGVSTLIQSANAKSSGAQYISRTAPGSQLRTENIGCTDVFPTIGSGLNLKLDADRKRYDGTTYQYVNWLSEIPWIEMRRERQTYSCVANGQTFTGNVGIGNDGINPSDYINRFGTTPSSPLNTPFIIDVYGKALGGGAVTIWWRPVCAPYRATITGYHLYVDGIKVTPPNSQVAKERHSFAFTTINTGTRNFQIVVVDPVIGNSGLSRPLYITVT